MKVENFHVKNQYIITDETSGTFFQSYNSIIAKRDLKGQIYLDVNTWDYSKTKRI